MASIYRDPSSILSLEQEDITPAQFCSRQGERSFYWEEIFLEGTRYQGMSARRIAFRFLPADEVSIQNLALSFRFLPEREELWGEAGESFHWIPNLCPEPGYVAADHVFRSPACIVTAGEYSAALIPDLKELATQRTASCYLAMDFSGPPRITYGIAHTEPYSHVYYRLTGIPFSVSKSGTGLTAYLLTSSGASREAFLHAVSGFLWDTFASKLVKSTVPQTVPFFRYAEYGYSMALKYLWQPGPKPSTGGIVLSTFQHNDGVYGGREYRDDLWFHAWFNNLRTAAGMYCFGDALKKPEWKEKARSVARLLLTASGKEGIFSTIYAPHDGGWITSSRHGGGPGLYSLVDCAWAALWLRIFLRRSGETLPGAEDFLKRFRRFLYRHQNPCGGFPCWVDADTLSHDPRLEDAACSSMPLWFLAEEVYHGHLSAGEHKKAMKVMEKGASHLKRAVIAQNRFEDFELYFSCSRKPIGFYDPVTRLYGQNTLAIQWCAGFLGRMYDLTGDPGHLKSGVYCTDLLCLYQQIWNPPYLSMVTFGGFGVMNTDAEWNDARQAQFAMTLAEFYERTGAFDYLERAVAAARASFALMAIRENRDICPSNYLGTAVNFEIHGGSAENYGHDGKNRRNYQSGFHWGTGSALTTAILLKDAYRDVYVDPSAGRALGIDGIGVTGVSFEQGAVVLELACLENTVEFDILIRDNARHHLIPRVAGHEILQTGVEVFRVVRKKE